MYKGKRESSLFLPGGRSAPTKASLRLLFIARLYLALHFLHPSSVRVVKICSVGGDTRVIPPEARSRCRP